jgi:hypothetical protein
MPLTNLSLQRCDHLRDLTPLKGLPLRALHCYQCSQLRDVTPLKGMLLETLTIRASPQVQDLTGLEGMPLTCLDLERCTQVQDLTPLKGMALTGLHVGGTSVTDLTVVADMKLEWLGFTPKNITKGIDGLRNMKSLKCFNHPWAYPVPIAEFWKRYDAGEFNK